ncbi:hypothetical protein AJ80_05757 [Polytolypa hystricis UAMH7299]|uniref:Gfd2/YDR514C-like C-terminal domain-containing protein n=1 Tax=Polytolypa hystricis (strain UAMH7299) TaxID=1447883 RepID=A0A2B7Y1B3_POLH7|nr:hypothetical protein AJ80_05757 [Polytolypa hystricis UAMH7299]
MDRLQRLNLLFEGDDSHLLGVDVGLQSPAESSTLHETTPDLPTSNKLAESGCTKDGALDSASYVATQCSDSEEGFDEYMLSFSRAARQATMKSPKKQRSKGTRTCHDSAGPGITTTTTTQQSDLAQTAESPHDGDGAAYFCPILAVSRFPYKYIGGGDADRIAKTFFDAGKFWNRSWEIYYIHPPPSVSPKPLLLVPREQVQELIDEINKAFSCQLSIPSDKRFGFLISFVQDGMPQPQFLGISSSREDKDAMERRIPRLTDEQREKISGLCADNDRSFEAFRAKIEAAVAATRHKAKASKEKKHRDHIQKLQDWCRSLKRTQCYLGLRPRRPHNLQPPQKQEGMSWEEQQQAEDEYKLACGISFLPFDVNQPTPFPFANTPIFISVDVEANERCKDQITEIGVSTLDTLDLVGVAPGEGGRNWVGKIRSRHFRVSERAHIVNKEYVAGCPDKFEFGKSEFVSLRKAAQMVDSCFQPPYSGHITLPEEDEDKENGGVPIGGKGTPTNVTAKLSNLSINNAVANLIPEYKIHQRNIILVGHDVSCDISFLRNLGCKTFKPTAKPNSSNKTYAHPKTHVLESLDTTILFRVLKRKTDPSSLGKVLLDLGLTGWNLHNAGNDARYTMEALISVAIESRVLLDGPDPTLDADGNPFSTTNGPLMSGLRNAPLSKEDEEIRAANAYDSAWKAETERRVAAAVEDSESRVRDECANWDIALGWNGDGDGALNYDVDGGVAMGILR